MQTEPGMASSRVITISWLAASAAFPLALISAAVGQALGAMAGGCHWIGVALPLDRPVWALVNQPVLNFASLPRAGGYWLGSLIVPLLIAVTIIGFLPSARSLVTQLFAVHTAWAMAVVAVAIEPVLDLDDGHLVRFLALHGVPTEAVWLAPIMAAGAGLLPTLRLLQLARRRTPALRRGHRTLLVVVHLGIPATAWIGLVSVVRGDLVWSVIAAAAMPLAAALGFAWLRFANPYVRELEQPRAGGVIGLAVAALALAAAVWTAGRPLVNDRTVGLLWSSPQAFNNIRPWIEPRFITDNTEATPPSE